MATRETHTKPYRDPDYLRVAYIQRDFTAGEIGDIFGVSEDVIRKHLYRHNITKKTISKEMIISDIQTLANELDRSPTITEFKNNIDRYSSTSIYNYFDSWGDALTEAGFESREHPIPDKKLIEDLQRVAGEMGKAPTAAEYTENGEFSHRAQYRAFGDWHSALREAGVFFTSDND